MRYLLLAAFLLGAAAPAAAQYTGRDLEVLREADRAAAPSEQEMQRRTARAKRNCEANRGTDCNTPEGLREWLLLERSRAEAVLDRVYPFSASTGSSAAPAGSSRETPSGP